MITVHSRMTSMLVAGQAMVQDGVASLRRASLVMEREGENRGADTVHWEGATWDAVDPERNVLTAATVNPEDAESPADANEVVTPPTDISEFSLDLPQRAPMTPSDSQDASETPRAGLNLNSEKGDESNVKADKGMNLARIGTLIVLGAVASNVFGFRFSKWALGKELHRAWEGRARRRAAQAATSAAASAASAAASAAARAAVNAAARAAARTAAQRTFGAQAAAAAAAAAARAQRVQREQARRARSENGSEQRNNSGNFRSGSASGPGWSASWRTSGNVRIDEQTLEEMLRNAGLGGDRVLEEMLRAARAASTGSASRSARDAEAEAQRFWEEVLGGRGGFAGGDPFGSARGAGPGVFTRENFDNAKHYRALGLEPGADMDEVKKAYRKLVMKWHPDRYRGDRAKEAAERFREITQAYEAITKR